MNEKQIANFWESHPCGEAFIEKSIADYESFFSAYDQFRYRLESHILKCLDDVDWKDKKTLEIGLGQGADSEKIIRRGAIWNGLDLTKVSIDRVKTRLSLKNLPYNNIKQGSVLNIPWEDHSFDVIFSHGVLHHVPDIKRAQKEIARVLKPKGELIVMLYAKNSLNYRVSICILRRIALIILYLIGMRPKGISGQHIENAKKVGLLKYLHMKNFIHRNTDGPFNPYSKVYDPKTVKEDFSLFHINRIHKEYMHAPPLPVHGLAGAKLMGWHLWVHMALK